jgi:hypothetical protein
MIAIALALGNPKACYAGAIDRSPPGGEFFEAQSKSFARVVEAQHSAIDRGQHLGLRRLTQ